MSVSRKKLEITLACLNRRKSYVVSQVSFKTHLIVGEGHAPSIAVNPLKAKLEWLPKAALYPGYRDKTGCWHCFTVRVWAKQKFCRMRFVQSIAFGSSACTAAIESSLIPIALLIVHVSVSSKTKKLYRDACSLFDQLSVCLHHEIPASRGHSSNYVHLHVCEGTKGLFFSNIFTRLKMRTSFRCLPTARTFSTSVKSHPIFLLLIRDLFCDWVAVLWLPAFVTVSAWEFSRPNFPCRWLTVAISIKLLLNFVVQIDDTVII